MSRRRFLLPGLPEPGERVELSPEEAAHAVKVLRLKPGEDITLLDGRGAKALAMVETAKGKTLAALVREKTIQPRPVPQITICPALLKAPAMDQVVSRLTELAVNEIRPFISSRSVPRLKDPADKVERWQRLAGQGIKQCGAAWAPEIHAPVTCEELLAQAEGAVCKIFLFEAAQGKTLARALDQWDGASPVWGIVGPEGGFSPEEAALITGRGFAACRLPHTILRAETASLALASVLRLGK